MLNHTSKKAIALATVAAICTMAGLARADDGGAEDYMIPAAFITGDGNGSEAVSCRDVREAAWFEHELARTDGDVNPKGDEPYCKPDLFAESTVDAD
jgi:hypothetical protein